MFLSWQTYEGLRMTILSLSVVVPNLLIKGLKYVLSEKFCQDDVEIILEGKELLVGGKKTRM